MLYLLSHLSIYYHECYHYGIWNASVIPGSEAERAINNMVGAARAKRGLRSTL